MAKDKDIERSVKLLRRFAKRVRDRRAELNGTGPDGRVEVHPAGTILEVVAILAEEGAGLIEDAFNMEVTR